jgi:hypothetical protein
MSLREVLKKSATLRGLAQDLRSANILAKNRKARKEGRSLRSAAQVGKDAKDAMKNANSNGVVVIHELIENLYDSHSPYESVDLAYVDHGYPDTEIVPELLTTLFTEIAEPGFILECGSMLGGSAMVMAKLINELKLGAEIVCVDPFTGDVNMWDWEINPGWKFLRLEHGIPTIYRRFLANVANEGLDDKILPINCTTTVGIPLLKRLREKGRISSTPNYIYLDSAHEPDETLLELRLCWGLLEDGGILLGDDWGWDAVRNDVLRFSREIEIDQDRLTKTQEKLAGSEIAEGKILIYKGQWVLFA